MPTDWKRCIGTYCTYTHAYTRIIKCETGIIVKVRWNEIKKSSSIVYGRNMCVYCAISILPNTHAHAETTTTESDWRMKAPGGPQITIAFMSSPPRSRAGDRPRDLCAYMLLLRQWLPVAPTSGPNGFSLFYINTHTHTLMYIINISTYYTQRIGGGVGPRE